MKKDAFIFDLDNTIYPVTSIGDKLFRDLFKTIEKDGGYKGDMEQIKKEIMRKPFQYVARDFHFTNELTTKGLNLLSNLTYKEPIQPFKDYFLTKKIEGLKFLVTKGFKKMQLSKIEKLGIQNDFQEIFIIDPATSQLTKKEVFQKIISRYNLKKEKILIIGDDIHSEIRAGKELGIDTVVYNYQNHAEFSSAENIINNFSELKNFI
jgi:putative hydrolase of the HAD superfamily